MKETPKLESPLVICGLPGAALVGKVALDHLVQELGAKPLAEVHCGGLAPQIFVEPDGTISVLKNEIYYWKGRRKAPDVILYTGDSQPEDAEAEYFLSDAVLEYLLKEHHAKEVVTLGAYVTGTFTPSPRVFGSASDAQTAERLSKAGCTLMADGVISGMNGLLMGIAKVRGVSSYALLGETSGYALDPNASRALLLSLEKIAGISVDLKELEERAKEASPILETATAARQEQAQPTQEERKKPGYIS